MSSRTSRRLVALPASLALAASILAPAAAHADGQQIELVAQHGTHSIYLATGETYDAQDPGTYWDFIPLDGMCGFSGTRLVLDNMDEVFGINTKERGAKAGSFTGTGKILDETFMLDELDADGDVVRTYAGKAVELAEFRGTGDAGQFADIATNLTVRMQGESPDGHKLGFMLRAKMLAPQGKFELGVSSCHVN